MIYQTPPTLPTAFAEVHKQHIPVSDPYLKNYGAQAPHSIRSVGPTRSARPAAATGGTGSKFGCHSAGLHGFNAEMRYIPALELGIVVLKNASPGAHQAGEVVNDLMASRRQIEFD
jgi:hypothetical protein